MLLGMNRYRCRRIGINGVLSDCKEARSVNLVTSGTVILLYRLPKVLKMLDIMSSRFLVAGEFDNARDTMTDAHKFANGVKRHCSMIVAFAQI